MRIVFMTFTSLDGVTQGPGSPDEDTSGGFDRGGWFVPFLDDTFLGIVEGWADAADAYLFGRRTYTAFAEAWPNMPDPDDPVARSLNGCHKYVVSGTLDDTEATWGPATVLRGDVVAAVRALKAQTGGELQIHGSTTLGRSMLDAGLVDELRLVCAPVVVGDGRRLFERSDHATGLRLLDLAATPGGLAVQTYAVDGPATTGSYHPAARS
ncbi:dihydrofolate reductase family protein [Euzebya sp.]|uniref:dihydrofolate reductase family protein n=1 Tax=Euzebya sp. TaxID=1971409 RepID=UPI0035141781